MLNHLRPWVLGHAPICAPILTALRDRSPRHLDPLDPAALPFFHLVNAGNQLAYGGLGMPAWVQLDCCTLPSAMIGLAAPRDRLPEALLRDLIAQVERRFGADAADAARRWPGPVPVSEYCATPTWTPGTVVGFSLYALLPGMGLGARTKALALTGYGCDHQIGLAQYDNRAVRAHAALGPLELLHPRAWPHDHPDRTFVYRLTIDPDRLDAILAGGPPTNREPPDGALLVPLAPEPLAERLDALTQRRGPLAIVWPGLTRDGAHLVVRPLSEAPAPPPARRAGPTSSG